MPCHEPGCHCQLTRTVLKSESSYTIDDKTCDCGHKICSHDDGEVPALAAAPAPPTARLFARIPRGASFQDLKKWVYRLAEESTAFDGRIAYQTPVTSASDLEILLFFPDIASARHVETKLMQAVRDRWRSDALPVVDVEPAPDHPLEHRVYAHHYDKDASPARGSFEHPDYGCDSPSHQTTVLQAEEIEEESVVNSSGVDLKFERCHINACLKGRPEDTTGNHIPLPIDWHRFFDAYTWYGAAPISIAPAGPATACIFPDDVGRGGRIGVSVHVYFDPASRSAVSLIWQLRDAVVVRTNVFAVRVHKKEPEKFVRLLQERHDAVVQKWTRVP